MMSNESSVTNEPWVWAAIIESLAASPSVDVSVLLEVIEMAPDIPDNLGKTMKERIALLCLEALFCPAAGQGEDTSSATDAKIRIDPSKSAEDVLQAIVHKTSRSISNGEGLELNNWDLNSYINERKLSMPKTSLQQLKETLFKAPNSYAASLKKISGLKFSVAEDTCNVSANVNEVQNISKDRNLLPAKRPGVELAAENTGKQCRENQGSIHASDDLHPKVKKVKDTSMHVHFGEETLTGREIIEDSPDRQGNVATADGYLLRKNNLGTSYEGNISGNKEDMHVISQMPQQSDTDGNESYQHQLDAHSRSKIISNDASISKLHRNKYGINGKENDEHRDNEDHTSGEPHEGPLRTASANGFQENCGLHAKAQKTVSAGILQQKNIQDKANSGINCIIDSEISSDSDENYNERLDIAEKKHEFLNSQSFSYDTLSNAECTEQSICMKCKKDGDLLSCSAKNCVMVLHQKCVGCLATFDPKGNFYCSFCALAHAHQDHKRSKREADVARRKLSAFVCNRNDRSEEDVS